MIEIRHLKISGYTVTIDSASEHLLIGRSWFVQKPKNTPYMKCIIWSDGIRRTQSFHRLVMGVNGGEIVDHINGNSLDNRRQNLRLVNAKQNTWNSAGKRNTKSKFKGVSWSVKSWKVSIRVAGKVIYVGKFKNEVEAAYRYDLASLKHHGEYGRRNFLPLVL